MEKIIEVSGKSQPLYIAHGNGVDVILLENLGPRLWSGVEIKNGKIQTTRGFAKTVTCCVY